VPYSDLGLSWRPGWAVNLTQGEHTLDFRWAAGKPKPGCVIDAVCLQSRP
jgi:hypothetical protein